MTGKRQKERIMKIAHGIMVAEGFRRDGNLEDAVRLMEADRSMFPEIEHDAIMAYSIAVKEFAGYAGEPWDE